MLDRPGAGDVMFGFGSKFGAGEDGEVEESEEEAGETRMVGVAEMLQWKVVA
jgi:hypothetical protein